MASSTDFREAISGHNVIAAPQAVQGGVNNFYFNNPPKADDPEPPEPFSTVPFPPDEDFIDRPRILEWLDGKCARPAARAALVGIGGIGKSQLAIHYAYKVRERRPNTYIFWVHASTRARFEEAYHYIAEMLNLPGRDDPKINVLQLVTNWLRKEDNGPWQLILDNADDGDVFFSDPQNLASFLPQSLNGSIVVTSRSMAVSERLVGNKNIYSVSTLEKEQAMYLLNSKLQANYDQTEVEELARTLDNIPLAITQAAAFINRGVPRTSIPSYLHDIRKNDAKKSSILNKEGGDLRRDPTAANSIIATWQITFEQIRRESLSAANLLSFMSLFNPQGIPESLLKVYSEEDGIDFDEDLEVIRSYALVSMSVKASSFEIHPLVQFCTQVWLSSIGDLETWNRRFLHIMADEFPNGDYETWTKCQLLLPHVEQICKREPRDPNDIKQWGHLLKNVGWYFYKRGKYDAAEYNCRRAVSAGKMITGDERNLAWSMTNLGAVLSDRGDFYESEKLHRGALKIFKKELTSEHPHTLLSLNELAICLRQQAKYNEAEEIHRKVLLIQEKVLGPNHPVTLTSLNNLAEALQDQGMYKEAKEIHRKVFSIREKVLGPNHPKTLTSLNNLGLALQDQGTYKEAEEIHRKVFLMREKELGLNHPDTLMSLNNLARALQDQGIYKEAEEIHRKVFSIREKVLGPNHLDTLIGLNNLGSALQDQGIYKEAEEIYRKVFSIREKVLGPNHPETLIGLNNLGSALQDQGIYKEAEEIHQKVLAIQEKELGLSHRDTLASVENLGNTSKKQHNYRDAVRFYERAYDGYVETLGIDHHYSVECLESLTSLKEKMRDSTDYRSRYPTSSSKGSGVEDAQHGEHRNR